LCTQSLTLGVCICWLKQRLGVGATVTDALIFERVLTDINGTICLAAGLRADCYDLELED